MNDYKKIIPSFVLCAGLASAAFADDGTGNIECPLVPEDIERCSSEGALLPDLMTVVPKHLSIQNKQQKEFIRFTNGLANLGLGPWWLEPETAATTDTGTSSCQAAYQLVTSASQFPNRQILPSDEEIPAPNGTFIDRCQKGQFDYHETHNHWHIANVGQFKICHYDDFVVGTDSEGKRIVNEKCIPAQLPDTPDHGHEEDTAIGIKFTFCLIDWYKLGDNSPNSDDTRNYFACETGFQGVSPGWVDQYHHSTDGQNVEITGISPGRYALISTVNSEVFGAPLFEETDISNNTSWVVFDLLRESNGNPKLSMVDGACDSSYRLLDEKITPAVNAFVDYYHGGDATFAGKVINDMCGGKTMNR